LLTGWPKLIRLAKKPSSWYINNRSHTPNLFG
jgi:hypothetical protein